MVENPCARSGYNDLHHTIELNGHDQTGFVQPIRVLIFEKPMNHFFLGFKHKNLETLASFTVTITFLPVQDTSLDVIVVTISCLGFQLDAIEESVFIKCNLLQCLSK